MEKNKKRIHLLSQVEIKELYERPVFNHEERILYFTLNADEISITQQYSHAKTRLYFMLQLGYFKAKQQFYLFDLEEVIEDAQFVNTLYFNEAIEKNGKITREYFKSQKESILKLYHYSQFSDCKEKILSHLCSLLRVYPKLHNALRQLLIYFDQNNIILPPYRTLQDLFTQAYRIEKNRLNQLVSSIPDHIQSQLTRLIQKNNDVTELNIARADQKDFQYTAVKLEIEKANQLADLYQFAKSFILKLDISKNSIQYYADITEQYSASRLRKLKKPQQWLHLICFAYYRYQQLMDNLIISFMYHVRTTVADGKVYAELAQLEYSAKLVVDFPKLAEFLKWFPAHKNRSQMTYSQFSEEAYRILPEEQFVPLSTLIAGNTFDKKAARWEFYEKSSRLFALYLRPILMTVDFTYYTQDHRIMNMIDLLKNYYASGKSPSSFRLCDDLGLTVPQNMIQYLKSNPQNKYLDPHRFEFFVYEKIYHYLNRGKLFCNDSVSYRDLENDLVPEKMVDDIDAIAQKFGYSKNPHLLRYTFG